MPAVSPVPPPPPRSPAPPPSWLRYGVAVAGPIVAILIQIALTAWLGHNMPILLLTLAISIIAYWFGLGPGLTATALSAAAILFAIAAPGVLPFTLQKNGEVTRLVVFVATGVFTSFMAHSLQRARNDQQEMAQRALRDAEALRDREELLRSITENSSDIIFAKDREGRFVFMNRAGFLANGLTPEKVLGHTDEELHANSKEAASYHDCDRRVMETEQTEVVEEQYTSPTTGGERVFLTTKTPLRDATQRVIGIVGVVHDITQHKRAEEALRASEERLRLAAQAGGFGTYMRDFESGVIWWSDELKQIARLPLDTVITSALVEELIHPDDRARISAARATGFARDTAEHFEDEYRWRLADGSLRWIFVKGRTTFTGTGADRRPKAIVGAVLDVTDRKAVEEALRESKLTAEAARSSADAARESAEAASRAKDDFLAALSHELRNPLNPVLLLASELETDPALSPAARADWSLVRKNISLEARLIDDLLDLTSIVRGKLAVSVGETDVHNVLHEALETVRADLEEKRIVLTLDLAATARVIWADPVRLQQIFWNVLKNAVKFTPAGGAITVLTRAEDDEIRLEVSDSGIGMNDDELARVFDAFSQGDHAGVGGAHRFGGLGLGLAITKQLVVLHSGRIQAQSGGRGRGSNFLIHFPLVGHRCPPEHDPAAPVETAPSAEATLGGTSSAHRRPRLLLVEDHDATRSTLARLLDRRGFDVISAATLAEARGAAAREEFELLVSDLGLPDGSGHTFMAELRDLYGNRVRGIALSGYGMEEDVTRSQEAGFAEHLTKPVEIQMLDEALRRLRDERPRVESRVSA